MRIFVINLRRAVERRKRIAEEFDRLDLPYELYDAVDGENLLPEHFAQVDYEARHRLGLRPQDPGSIGCWFSHRGVMQKIVDEAQAMATVFEDDARLSSDVPSALRALERRPFPFDVVSLYRRDKHMKRPFIDGFRLTGTCTLGRVRFSDDGLVGYVITREAAKHFLRTTTTMTLPVDEAVLRFWLSGLNVYYAKHPLVFHGGYDDSYIESGRLAARELRRKTDNPIRITWRRLLAGAHRFVHRRIAFYQLRRGQIGVTRWQDLDD